MILRVPNRFIEHRSIILIMRTMLILGIFIISAGAGRIVLSGCSSQGNRPKVTSAQADDNRVFTVGRLQVRAFSKSLIVSVDGKTIFELPAQVAVDIDGSPDNDMFEPAFRIENDRCTWTVRTSNWEKKEYSLSCEGPAIVLRLKVQGKGKLGKLRYFPEGGKSGKKLSFEVSRYFVPVALGGAKAVPQWHNTMESANIDLYMYMTPPLLAFPFTGPFSGTCAIGLAPKPGAYNIDHFRCEFASFRDGLFSTDYLGYTEVNGTYELPVLTFTSGTDEFASLAAHSDWLYQFGGCTRVDRSNVPSWWLGPIYCGYGDQHILSPNANGATQKNYTILSRRLDELGLKPAVIIIDAKWQDQLGAFLPDTTKWPDLRAFVDAEHAKGRKILLWLKAWDNEGLRSEECVRCYYSTFSADPTSPAYQKRIKETMHKLLSSDPGCFDCDGFKIDFANCMPSGKDLVTHERGIYGIELLKRMMTLLHDAAKAAKPNCLINNSCSHPYFAEVTDQCRLHDFPGQLRFLWEVREYRAKLFRTAFPGISIDTDDERSSSKEQSLNYIRRAPEIGVPVLYCLHNPFMTDDDYREIAKIWADYSRKLDK